MHLTEFINSELKVLGHLGKVLIVLFVEDLDKLLDNEYVEVIDAVFEDIDALVFDDGVVRKRLVNTSMLGYE